MKICDVPFVVPQHWILNQHKEEKSHKNSREFIENLSSYPLHPHPSPYRASSLFCLSYFCLLSAQSITFRPRWLLIWKPVVDLTYNGHMKTKDSLLGWGVPETDGLRGAEAGKKENGVEEWHSAFHCGWTHIWWPCVTGAAGLMMGFLRPAQLGQVSPDSQREAEREMTIDMLVTVCASLCIWASPSRLPTRMSF